MQTIEHSQPTLSDYLAALRRRKLVIISTTVLVAAAALLLSLQEAKVYRSSAAVLLSRQDLGSALTGTPDPTLSADPVRVAQTQVGIARLPVVAARAVKAARVPEFGEELLRSSSVTANTNSDILTFMVDNRDPRVAAKLANSYARAFTAYSLELATATLRKARLELERRLTSLQRAGDRSSVLYRSVQDDVQRLRTMELLQNPGTVVKTATSAGQIQPTPKRNGILGAVFGVLLGVALAFLWETLDKRVRSESEIEERLGLPLLSRLPPPTRRLSNENKLAMLDDPNDVQAEAVRRLRVNVEFANLDLDARTIMITSSVQQEGKSTTLANLAVALARSGRNVALVDLDLRQPTLAGFFKLPSTVGVTDVALGKSSLGQAIVPIRLAPPGDPSANGYGTMTSGGEKGSLSVLAAGVLPANPGEFIGTDALARVLSDLRAKYDLVLIDAPPMCVVGDAMTLSAKVDALIVVTRLGIVDRSMMHELARELNASPAPKLGFVLTGADRRDNYGTSGYYGSHPQGGGLAPRGRLGQTTASK